jgi:hypothetical protein
VPPVGASYKRTMTSMVPLAGMSSAPVRKPSKGSSIPCACAPSGSAKQLSVNKARANREFIMMSPQDPRNVTER